MIVHTTPSSWRDSYTDFLRRFEDQEGYRAWLEALPDSEVFTDGLSGFHCMLGSWVASQIGPDRILVGYVDLTLDGVPLAQMPDWARLTSMIAGVITMDRREEDSVSRITKREALIVDDVIRVALAEGMKVTDDLSLVGDEVRTAIAGIFPALHAAGIEF